MKVCHKISEIQGIIQREKSNGKQIGFVPTMGFLHEGHLSLIQRARKENDIVIVSIFVNPLQFGESEDFERYPMDVEKDRELLEGADVDYLFNPSVSEMYPKSMGATFLVHEGVDVLCGAKRPGHFNGVATVVMKLFGITTPHRAYFGLKDAQQLAVIERLVNDYHLDIEIIRGKTVREEDGLAKSSRNINLTKIEREEAPAIYNSLLETSKKMKHEGIRNTSDLEAFLFHFLSQRLTGSIDYAEIRSFPSLEKLESLEGEVIIAVAIKYSKARLIDNLIIQL